MEETTNLPAEEQAETLPDTSAQPEDAKKLSVKDTLKNYFTATRIAYIAIFTALSFVLRFLQFSFLPAVPYLQLDFSDTFVLVCAYALGPVAGMITGVLKEVIYGICFTSTSFVGELANILIMLPMVLIPSILYKKHKGIKSVLIGLTIGGIVRVIWCFPVNWLLNFPAFLGFNWELGMAMFIKVWYWAELFNLIKTVALAVTTLLLYKPLSKLIKLTNAKFNSLKKKKDTAKN
ncbi:MAG: ECF transporter S component [Clostridia bacterium]|nr:ECF transporter S component [Clostridia bacterium]